MVSVLTVVYERENFVITTAITWVSVVYNRRGDGWVGGSLASRICVNKWAEGYTFSFSAFSRDCVNVIRKWRKSEDVITVY